MLELRYSYINEHWIITVDRAGHDFELRCKDQADTSDDYLGITYSALLTPSQLQHLYAVLQARKNTETAICPHLTVVREPGKYSVMNLRFSSVLECIPLPREAATALMENIQTIQLV
ncbi:MAG: hypothetical protein HRU20_32375 [Pseudomonadales bacterium]|nr:hypothetical protein [Pseudomonadales bacterium]